MKWKSGILGILACVCVSLPANAVTTYDLTATSLFPSSLSNFTIQFDDTNGDMLLSYSEVVSFSGFTYTYSGGSLYYPTLTLVPNVAGFATFSGPGNGNSSNWTFQRPIANDIFLGVTNFSYSLTPLSTPAVPLPAALPLFASGLGALGLLAWRKKRKAATAV